MLTVARPRGRPIPKRKTNKNTPKSNSTSADVTRSQFVPPRNWLSSHIGGFPQSQRDTLNWVAKGTQNNNASIYAENVVILNGPYDPDAALGGLSAAGFAKYMAIYTKCFVLAVRYRVHFNNVSNQVAITCGTTVTTNSTSLSSDVNAIQSGLCDYSQCYANPDHRVFNSSLDIAKFIDKPDILDDPQFFCTPSANPTQIVCLHIWSQNQNSSVQQFVDYIVEVSFDCVFTDPITVV
jgi:hypothetical protein